jgi:hypothetical protein
MTRKIKTFGILFLLIVGQTVCGQKGEEKLVVKTFEKYKTAILNDKGKDAVKFVDSRTIKYYSDMLELVKTADSTKIETLSILDKLMVFTVRHRTSKEDILSFNVKSFLIYAIESGMVGKNSVANISIGEVTINKNFAKGQLIANGQKAPIFFHFYKEDKQWKVDLTSIFPISMVAFEQMVNESGMKKNEYLFLLLEMISGKKPESKIFRPIIE